MAKFILDTRYCAHNGFKCMVLEGERVEGGVNFTIPEGIGFLRGSMYPMMEYTGDLEPGFHLAEIVADALQEEIRKKEAAKAAQK